MSKCSFAITGLLLATLGACGGGSGSTAPAPSAPPPDLPASASAMFAPGVFGVVNLPSYASVAIPSSAFAVPTQVTVEAAQTPQTSADFDETTAAFEPSSPVSYEVRVVVDVRPTAELVVTLIVPDSLSPELNTRIAVFAQLFQDGGEEALDVFEPISAVVGTTSRTLDVRLPPNAFTDFRRADGNFEAILKMALTPASAATGSSRSNPLSSTISGCTGKLQYPLKDSITVSGSPPRQFNPGGVTHPITGLTTPHGGVDLVAAVGAAVNSVGAGRVVEVRNQVKSVQGRTVGWGWTVLVRNSTDGSTVRYAHLLEGSVVVNVGSNLVAGQPIGQADTSGGATGPHLHLEYTVNGSKVDPLPCFRQAYSGNFTIAGPAAITGSSCAGTLSFSGDANVDVGESSVLRFTGTEGIALSCFSQSIPVNLEIPLNGSGTKLTGSVTIPFTCAPPCVTGQTSYSANLDLVSVGGGRSTELRGTLAHSNANQTPFSGTATGQVVLPSVPLPGF